MRFSGKLGAIAVVGVIAAIGILAVGSASAASRGTRSTVTFCTDLTYPPSGFTGSDGVTPMGFDIDIAHEIGRRIGDDVSIANTLFDGILPALLADKCQAVISAMNDTAARRKQVSFVDYLATGKSILVKTGNPDHITSLASMCGHAVSVELGTTNRDLLEAQSKKCASPIKIVTLSAGTDAFRQLLLGRVDAYFPLSISALYYLTLSSAKGKVEIAGKTIDPLPLGIAVRKDEGPLKAQIAKAVTAMTKDGTMTKIVGKWKMQHAVTLIK